MRQKLKPIIKYNKISEIENFENYFEWDKYNWSKSASFFEKYSKKKLMNSVILELGSRTGMLGYSASLCGAKVTLSDLKEKLDPVVKKKIDKREIKFKYLNAIDFKENIKYDIIIAKSLLGGLKTKENQLKCINCVYKNLKVDGEFWLMENLNSTIVHRLLRYLFVPWSKNWRYLKPRELEYFFREFKTVKIESRGILSLFGRNEKQRNFLANVDDKLIKILSKINWHTNAFIIGKK